MRAGRRWIAAALALVFSLSLALIGPGAARAEESVTRPNRFNVVLVMDKSGSLCDRQGVGTDPEGLRYDAMKLFLGLLTQTGNKVGVIAFDQQIRYDSGLRDLGGMEDRNALVRAVEALGTGYDTDIGGAVLRATELLRGRQADNGLPCAIVLLTDGMTDFTGGINDTALFSQSRADAEKALRAAQEEGITVHGVLLNVDGRAKTGEAELRAFTGGTDGAFETVSRPEDLTAAFARFYSIINRTEYTGAQKVVLSPEGVAETGFFVPGFGTEEVNLVIEHGGALPEITVIGPDGQTFDADGLTLSTSRFALVKLPDPAPGQWTVRLEGSPSDSIDVCMIQNSSLCVALSADTASCEVQEPVRLTARLSDPQADITEDRLRSVDASLAVQTPEGELREYPMTATDGGFTAELRFDAGGDYRLTAHIGLGDFEVCSDPLKLSVTAPAPAAHAAEITDLRDCGTVSDGVWEVPLDGLFDDPKGGGLRYALSDTLGGALSIEDGVLKVDLTALGDGATFTVTATNIYGQTAELPVSFTLPRPAAAVERITDLNGYGRLQGNVWILPLDEVFQGDGLRYTLSDTLGGAAVIENGVLKVDLSTLGDTTAFTVTATDANGLSTALPVELALRRPTAAVGQLTDLDAYGQVRDGVWILPLEEVFRGDDLRYTLSGDLGGAAVIEDGVLYVDLKALGDETAFTVTATDAHGLSEALPVDLSLSRPAAVLEEIADIEQHGKLQDGVWTLRLDEVFMGTGLGYTLSDDLGGAASIRDGALNVQLSALRESAAFTVTATDANGLTAELPVQIRVAQLETTLAEITDITAHGQLRDGLWAIPLDELFQGDGLSYTLSDNLGGAVMLEGDVLLAKLSELGDTATFTVTATDAYGKTVELPFVLEISRPATAVAQIADITERGTVEDGVWSIPLDELFTGDELAYSLSDDLGGAAVIEDGVLKIRLSELDGAASLSVTATGANGLKASLPVMFSVSRPVAAVDSLNVTVKTGLLHSGVWETELDGLFREPSGGALSYALSDDFDGRLALADGKLTAKCLGLGLARFSLTATNDYGLRAELPVQLTEQNMTWRIVVIALLVLVLLIAVIWLLRRRK